MRHPGVLRLGTTNLQYVTTTKVECKYMYYFTLFTHIGVDTTMPKKHNITVSNGDYSSTIWVIYYCIYTYIYIYM